MDRLAFRLEVLFIAPAVPASSFVPETSGIDSWGCGFQGVFIVIGPSLKRCETWLVWCFLVFLLDT